jgi:mono/diheme cytochrome c family protein
VTTMRWWLASAFVLSAGAVFGQEAPAPPAGAPKVALAEEEDYSKAMKEVAARNTALRKSLASSSDADALASAARLEVIFKDVQAYWENRKAEDAVTAAKNAVAAAQSISKAVAAHDPAATTAALQALGGTCGACHSAHRDRLAFDFYRIK